MALNNYDIWQRAIPVPLNTLAFLAWMIKLRTPGKKIDLAFWNKKIEDRFDFLELKFEDKSGKRIEYSTYIWNKFYDNACLRLKIGFLTCSILRTLENMTHHFFYSLYNRLFITSTIFAQQCPQNGRHHLKKSLWNSDHILSLLSSPGTKPHSGRMICKMVFLFLFKVVSF